MIRTIADAEKALLPYVGLVGSVKKDMTLERIHPLMAAAGSPEKRLAVIHLAGTSGKTSTSYFIAALLSATGKKVGLTVSPHVDSITERVQVNGEPLSEKVFCELLEIFLKLVDAMPDKPSYFELMYAFALWVFDRMKVDYAVVETGMGGLYDATNVVESADKVCVITDIGYDHMHALGNSLAEIARQKAGIIHPNNHVFMYAQNEQIMQAINRRVNEQGAELHLVDESTERLEAHQTFDNVADFQQHNWLLAFALFKYIQTRDHWLELPLSDLAATTQLQVPARMERRQLNGKSLVMDGAHNADKMAVFIKSYQKLYPGIRPAVLLALKESKDYAALVPLLSNFTAHIIVTTFNTSQDLPARSVNPEILSAALRAGGIKSVEAFNDHKEAFLALQNAPEPALVITGSFYLLSQLRSEMAQLKPTR